MTTCIQPLLITLFITSLTITASADIIFKDDWDSGDYNNVKQHTQQSATRYIYENGSESIQAMIDSPAKCRLEVTKGCHQPNDPHFTINGLKSTNKCKNIYGGTRSFHFACE